MYGIVEESDTSVVKIGYTKTSGGRIEIEAARKRLGGLQVGTWRPLICIAASPGLKHHERGLHLDFRPLLVRGEWFRNEGDVALWLEKWRLCGALTSRRDPLTYKRRKPKRRRHLTATAVPKRSVRESRIVRQLDEIAAASRRIKEHRIHSALNDNLALYQRASSGLLVAQAANDEKKRREAELEQWLLLANIGG